MKRRTLLATVGAGVAGLAGCSSALDRFEPTEGGNTETPRQAGRLPGRPDGDTASCSSLDDGYSNDALPVRNLPGTGDRFTDLGCPTFEWADRTVCQHGEFESEPAVMVSQTQQVYVGEDSSAQAEFALANRSGGEVETHPGTWTVLRPNAAGEDWSLVASGGPSCTRTIAQEESHWWRLGIRQRLTSDFVNVTAGTADLGPGTYVFAAPAFLPSGDHVMCAAPFEVIDISDTDIGSTATPTPAPDTPADGTPR